MLEAIISCAKKLYNWDNKYTYSVLYEYERFMYIRSLDSYTSPPESIEKFWHIHILYTENYYNYCIDNYGKFIHHNPDTSLDQKRITNTIKLYIQIFPSVGYPEIWNINTELANIDLTQSSNLISSSSIQIKIIYIYDNKYLEKSRPYENKELKINITSNMTYEDLIRFISEKTLHPDFAITIFASNKTFIENYKNLVYIDPKVKININISKYYIFELDEIKPI